VYEYANRLAAKGHELTIVHPRSTQPDVGLRAVRHIRNWRRERERAGTSAVTWFPVCPSVQVLFTPDLRCRYVPSADVVIASAWWTAKYVADYPASRGVGFYLIQHFEDWDADADTVASTWRLGLRKLVIAKWLVRLADVLDPGGDVTYVPNGIDTVEFRMTVAPSQRDPASVLMMAHELPWKGTSDGVAALELAKKVHPALKACLFGVSPRPAELPSWITYVENPSGAELRGLYNEAAIFVHPSHREGWPLPPAEAMASGCALVTAGNDGVQDYADEACAMVVPIGDSGALASALVEAIAEPSEREELARHGNHEIQYYSWERAVSRFEAALSAERRGTA
jgi:glycosyltransferase involved in cell wall biosynthesis